MKATMYTVWCIMFENFKSFLIIIIYYWEEIMFDNASHIFSLKLYTLSYLYKCIFCRESVEYFLQFSQILFQSSLNFAVWMSIHFFYTPVFCTNVWTKKITDYIGFTFCFRILLKNWKSACFFMLVSFQFFTYSLFNFHFISKHDSKV